MSRSFAERLAAVLLFGLLLVAWEVAVRTGYLKVYKFPPPSKISAGFLELATTGFPTGISLWSHTLTTLQRYAAAVALAIPVGFVIGAFPVLEKITAPIEVFCRSIATLSLLPLAIVWFGGGELTKVVLIGYGCFWVMLSNVIAAVKYVEPVLLRMGRVFGLNGLALYGHVVLPAAAPRMFAGARMVLGVGFIVIVGAEMIGTIEGLGALIMEAKSFYRSEITVLGMVVIGLLGIAITGGLGLVQRWLMPWSVDFAGTRQ